MLTRSAKNKGKRLQNKVRDLLLEAFKDELEPDDIRSVMMGESGMDIKYSPKAKPLIPYAIECKNQEQISIWSAIEQSEKNCPDDMTPTLIFKRNRSKTYAVIELDKFIELIRDKSK